MLKHIFSKIFGTRNEQILSALQPRIVAINALEPTIANMDNNQLVTRIQQLKQNLTTDCMNKDKNEIDNMLNMFLNEVFAIVRESSKRVLNMRHFDVQLLGGIALHMGYISEMRTGEGKTLTATLPAVLNSLSGKSVHIVTVNDYLASRDADWMGRIYRFLGLEVGTIIPQMKDDQKKKAYHADITYGQNNEFGFDYLRDNMKFDLNDYVQRDHHFAIIDEVDSILIDEARTPLIISGPTEDSSDKYKSMNSIVPKLRKGIDFIVEEKNRSTILTEFGIGKLEKLLEINNLYEPSRIEILHHLNQALRAHALFKKDDDYIIESGEVVIVDEHTGRLMHGRRWSDGLHQAIEAKENVQIKAENQTLATITFQNYFRMYNKLSGMTGTAETEAEEFFKIYNLDVLVIPTNKKMIRIDEQDQIYKTEHEKFQAIAKDIIDSYRKKQPVLVGTVSVEKSEILSRILNKLNVPHNVLNAKKHRDEASIIAQAGRFQNVTIATNMAGRGTDIVLGGDPEFMARTEVMKLLSNSEEQIAEFAFLAGDPRSIIPDTSKKEFQEKAITLYGNELQKALMICKKEKEIVVDAGGLRIIGTERHESRRIDNQLRGRAGRQGDPGSSRFYLSLQDNLMRIFGSDRIVGIMEKFGMKENEPITHPWISRSIENAQKRVEGFHFDSRKQLIEYDDVMNQQRNIIYSLRRKILGEENIKKLIFDIIEIVIVNLMPNTRTDIISDFKVKEICEKIGELTGVFLQHDQTEMSKDNLMDLLYKMLKSTYDEREKFVGREVIGKIEKLIYLQLIDQFWKNHLQSMDHLREGVYFRSYAQKDPKQEYKKEGFLLFGNMISNLRLAVLEQIFKVEFKLNSKQDFFTNLVKLEIVQQKISKQRKDTIKLNH